MLAPPHTVPGGAGAGMPASGCGGRGREPPHSPCRGPPAKVTPPSAWTVGMGCVAGGSTPPTEHPGKGPDSEERSVPEVPPPPAPHKVKRPKKKKVKKRKKWSKNIPISNN